MHRHRPGALPRHRAHPLRRPRSKGKVLHHHHLDHLSGHRHPQVLRDRGRDGQERGLRGVHLLPVEEEQDLHQGLHPLVQAGGYSCSSLLPDAILQPENIDLLPEKQVNNFKAMAKSHP